MSENIALFDSGSAVPAHITAMQDNLPDDQLAGGLSGDRDRISLKGNRFRLIVGGEEKVLEGTELDVIIVHGANEVGRLYYDHAYDPDDSSGPSCFSDDGVEPHESCVNKQAANCMACPQNVVGSAVSESGTKMRACGYLKRVAVVLASHPEANIFTMDIRALSLFGTGQADQGRLSFKEYSRMLKNRGYKAASLVTRLSFDTDESVPKLLLKPHGWLTKKVSATITKRVAEQNEELVNLVMLSSSVGGGGGPAVEAPLDALGAPPPHIEQEAAPAKKKATRKKATKKTNGKAAAPAAVAPVEAAPEPEPQVETEAAGGLDADIDNLLDNWE